MVDDVPRPGMVIRLSPLIQEDLRHLKSAWVWFVVFGLALITLGVTALAYSTLFTIATVEVLGFFLIFGGVLYCAGAFFTGSWGGFFLTLLTGVLQLVMGLLCARHPAEAAIVYTLLMAAFFMVAGLFRIVAALSGTFRGRGWVVLSGVITLALGVMIWQQSPISGLWVIGTFLGVDLIFNGWLYVVIGLNVRQLPV